MTDWRTMDAWPELDMLIAERLGWRFERPPWMSAESVLIFDADGREMYVQAFGPPPWLDRTTVVPLDAWLAWCDATED